MWNSLAFVKVENNNMFGTFFRLRNSAWSFSKSVISLPVATWESANVNFETKLKGKDIDVSLSDLRGLVRRLVKACQDTVADLGLSELHVNLKNVKEDMKNSRIGYWFGDSDERKIRLKAVEVLDETLFKKNGSIRVESSKIWMRTVER
jgi:hypothetical protein